MIQSTESHPMSLRYLLSEMEQRDATDDALILEPYTYIASNAGKNFRGRLIEGFNAWLEVPEKTLEVIKNVTSILHTASLMYVPVADRRHRGQLAAAARPTSGAQDIRRPADDQLCELHVLPRVPGAGAHRDAPEGGLKPLYDILTSELVHLHRGQGLEILWRDSLQCPTEEEYIDMVNNKTGGLLRIGIRLMMACATKNRGVDYLALTNMIGITFQIRDDLLNLQNSVYEVNKGFAEDLTEGKFSFPVIHSIRADLDNRQVINVLSQRPTSPTLKTHAISYMKTHTRSFEYTNRVLDHFQSEIIAELERLGGNESLQKLVDQFHAMARLPN
ncbi:hypothetical protein MKEN_01267600 [Mycena kentingensis (nom. inval.)]|nr:hypothetical protein MKEN_01267600 [Mycena kentingensis (nom. inval.)]